MQKLHIKKKAGRPASNTLTIYNMRGRPRLKREIKEYLGYCANTRRMSPKTMSFKEGIFNRFVRDVGVASFEELTNRDVNQWVAELTRRRLSAQTVNHCLSQITAMARYFDGMGLNLKLKIPMIEKQKLPDSSERMFYRRAEVAKALSYADRREWLVIALFFDCGLRIEELQHLRLTNIHGRNVSVVGKGAKLRGVKMSEETRKRLDVWIKSEGLTDYVFTSAKSGKDAPISMNQIRRCTREVFKCAGFDDYRPHKLRHSFAMDMYLHGVPVREIQFLMGHARLETTERYLEKLTRAEQDKIWDEKRFERGYTLDYEALVENSSKLT